MSSQFQDDTYLAKWLNGELSKDELQAFQERADYPLLLKIAETAKQLELPSVDEKKAWQSLRNKKQKQLRAKVIRRNWIAFATAAILTLAISFWFLQPKTITVTTPIAAQENIELPDQSIVTINAESELIYDKDQWKTERLVALKGEAFFEVEKDQKPFKVQTPLGAVEVLGTTFNVWARADELIVECYTGSVKVSTVGDEKILQAGEKVILEQGLLKMLKATKEEQKPSWTIGFSSFEDTPFQRVIQEVERQYEGIDIQIESTFDTIYNGGFPHNDIETALRLICEPFNLKYTQQDSDTYIIKVE